MDRAMEIKFQNIAPMISNTPLLEIKYKYRGSDRRIFAKAEYYNLSGSIKDRVAFHILKRPMKTTPSRKAIASPRPSAAIPESRFRQWGSYLGHNVVDLYARLDEPDVFPLWKATGAKSPAGVREGRRLFRLHQMTEDLAKQGNVFLPRQFSNEDNVEAHYLTTGEEIVRQLSVLGLKADGTVAGVGTGGTVMGIGKRLKKENPNCKVYPLEPSNSPPFPPATG